MPRRRLTDVQVRALASYRVTGSAKEAAERYGVTTQYVRRIRRGLRASSISRISPPRSAPPAIEFLSREDSEQLDEQLRKAASSEPLFSVTKSDLSMGL